ncbi:MAG: hypothetical protein IRY98_04820, partial [Alicyclobacillaceae bacterium]|nr:hypothetical protein [Alicyclobacillaceae bacterium]
MRSARYLWPVILAGAAGWATGVHAAHAGGAYAVFQYSHRLQEFNRLEDAIAYAKLWDHSRVVNVMTGEDEWDNYPSPIADLGYWIVRDGQRLQAAWNRQEAIQAASRIPGSIVLNALTGTVVWRNSSVSQPVTGTAPPSKTPPGGFPSNPNSNQRIPDRPAPYGPDYYWVEGRTLYHIFGTPGAPARSTIVVGPAPDFLQPGQVYVRDSSHRFYLRDASGDHFIGTWVPPYEALD